MDRYLIRMIEFNADGIDFMPLTETYMAGDYEKCKIIESYTRDEWKSGVSGFPKTPYVFYRLNNGKKEYIRGVK